MAETASREKVNRVAERLAETMQASHEAVIDHAVAFKSNVRLAQYTTEALAMEYRQQARANRAVTRELLEHVAEQRHALRTVVEESLDACMDFLYTPLSYYEEGLEITKKVAM